MAHSNSIASSTAQPAPIEAAPTAITAFIGRALRGPLDVPLDVHSSSEFELIYGPLWAESPLSYAVRQFFENGGDTARIVRVANNATPAVIALGKGRSALRLVAATPGAWGNALSALVDRRPGDGPSRFNLTVQEVDPAGTLLAQERFEGLSLNKKSSRFLVAVLEKESHLVRALLLRGARPPASSRKVKGTLLPYRVTSPGSDGDRISAQQVSEPSLAEKKHGLWALENNPFNLLCIPPFSTDSDVDPATWQQALAFCVQQRAFLIVDPPAAWQDASTAENGINIFHDLPGASSAALYFPRLLIPDPLQGGSPALFAPGAALVGLFARSDRERGVWTAPAGTAANLTGVTGLACSLDQNEIARLAPLGINPLRQLESGEIIVWGARTLAADDPEWKYVNIRRYLLFLERSIDQGLQWTVFEPNTELLWAQVRASVTDFLFNQWRDGALQGNKPEEAFFLKCDRTTMTQNDIDNGRLVVMIGIAPVKPAEFIILRLTLKTGDCNP